MIKHLKTLAVMLIAALALASCNSDNKDEAKTLTVTVGSKLVNVGVGTSSKLCMDITVEQTGAKLNLVPGEILGFTYEEGYKYRLKIKEIHVVDKNGNEIEIYYQLDTILSKERDDSTGPIIGPIPS